MNNKTEAYKFLSAKGINPVEPIYWDSPSKRIDLDELLQEFSTQQNKALTNELKCVYQSKEEISQNEERLKSELSQQKEELEFLKKVRIDQNDAICKLDSELTQQKDRIEAYKIMLDNRVEEKRELQSKVKELETIIDNNSVAVTELQHEIEGLKKNKSECLELVESIEKLVNEERELKQRYENKVESQAKEIEGMKKENEEADELCKKILNGKGTVYFSQLNRTIESQSLRIKELEEGIKDIKAIAAGSDITLHCMGEIIEIQDKLLSTPTTEPKEEKEQEVNYCNCNSPRDFDKDWMGKPCPDCNKEIVGPF